MAPARRDVKRPLHHAPLSPSCRTGPTAGSMPGSPYATMPVRLDKSGVSGGNGLIDLLLSWTKLWNKVPIGVADAAPTSGDRRPTQEPPHDSEFELHRLLRRRLPGVPAGDRPLPAAARCRVDRVGRRRDLRRRRTRIGTRSLAGARPVPRARRRRRACIGRAGVRRDLAAAARIRVAGAARVVAARARAARSGLCVVPACPPPLEARGRAAGEPAAPPESAR